MLLKSSPPCWRFDLQVQRIWWSSRPGLSGPCPALPAACRIWVVSCLTQCFWHLLITSTNFARDHPKGAPVSFVNIRTNAESDPFPEASVSCETSVKQAFKLYLFSKVRRRTAETNKKLTFCSQVGFGQISSPRCKQVSFHQGKT